MSARVRNRLGAIRARFDRYALEQLRTVAARLAEENEFLERHLELAQDECDMWRDRAAESYDTDVNFFIDGHLEAVDRPRYTRIRADGYRIADGDAADFVAILDERTGLMWDAKDASPKELKHEEAMRAAAAVRTGGFDDWRAPTRVELETLLDLTRHDPAADPRFNLKPDFYWSSTPLASSPADCAWGVDFGYGYAGYGNRNLEAFVRPVRVARASQLSASLP